jgi:hypothetical protein
MPDGGCISKEFGEQNEPVFEPVAVSTPQFDKDRNQQEDVRMFGLTLKKGSILLSKASFVQGLEPNERIIKYVRTSSEIIRIDPNGKMRRLELSTHQINNLGYFSTMDESPVALNSPFKANVAYNSEEDLGMANMWNQFSTKEPVIEVLLRTSRKIDESLKLNTVDTALHIGNSKRFR